MYKFRVVFSLGESTYLDSDLTNTYLLSDSGNCNLSSNDGKKINESNKLNVVGTGFNSEQEAQSKGQTIMNLLRLYSVVGRTGVSLGNNTVTGGISDYFQNKIYKETGNKVINEVNGLIVYEDAVHTKVASVSFGSGILYKGFSRFKDTFEENYNNTLIFSDKLVNAMDFYNLAMLTAAPKLRFLLFVIAIEAIIETKQRTAIAVEHVTSLITHTEDNLALTDSERSSILGSLKYLKNQSISQSGRELVEAMLGEKVYNGKPSRKFFTECYSLRSSLVHTGTWKEKDNELAYELERMVVDLLIAHVKMECQVKI